MPNDHRSIVESRSPADVASVLHYRVDVIERFGVQAKISVGEGQRIPSCRSGTTIACCGDQPLGDVLDVASPGRCDLRSLVGGFVVGNDDLNAI